ncbi:ABC-three component system protein [Clostridium botulinum]|uniref:ABC-three component system protein n=1 Tax=Clostridium botulinum TaxID=1491 RepID=UPI001967C617|nr:ABC-three component system protein [Clostridium botulinum]MBN1077742.1 hypothetical protein [Clostridium botulinum]
MFDNKNLMNQQAYSCRDTLQAARDINFYTININDLYFYEDDIKEVITFFNSNISKFKDDPFPDTTPIEIKKKNKLNNLSKSYFDGIKDKYLSLFGKIRSFLSNPANSDYVNMYINTTEELNPLSISLLSSVGTFDTVFVLLYNHIIKNCKDDKAFMKIRTKVLLFLHFMYYNCDIGIK